MKKTDKTELTKQKLIQAAGQLMKNCKNPEEVTSREIALKAGVQAAMINYCFGSREGLLFTAFSANEETYLSATEITGVIQSDLPPKEKLRHLHYIVSTFMIEQYAFSKAIAGYVLLHRDLTKESNSYPLIKAHFKEQRTKEECKMIAYELSSMMQLAIYRADELKDFAGIDLHDREQRERFIDFQIETLLP